MKFVKLAQPLDTATIMAYNTSCRFLGLFSGQYGGYTYRVHTTLFYPAGIGDCFGGPPGLYEGSPGGGPKGL